MNYFVPEIHIYNNFINENYALELITLKKENEKLKLSLNKLIEEKILLIEKVLLFLLLLNRWQLFQKKKNNYNQKSLNKN